MSDHWKLLNLISGRITTAMNRAFTALDASVSECESTIEKGAEVSLDGEKVIVPPEQLSQIFGSGMDEVRLFATEGRAFLDRCKFKKKGRATQAGVIVKEAPPELLEALRNGSVANGPAAMVQPTQIRMGGEAPLDGAIITGGKAKKIKDEPLKKP